MMQTSSAPADLERFEVARDMMEETWSLIVSTYRRSFAVRRAMSVAGRGMLQMFRRRKGALYTPFAGARVDSGVLEELVQLARGIESEVAS
jgi:hypothetical protein